MPTVRTAAVKSIELDPAPAPPAAASSSTATSEVSYAKPDQGKAADTKGSSGTAGGSSKGKDC